MCVYITLLSGCGIVTLNQMRVVVVGDRTDRCGANVVVVVVFPHYPFIKRVSHTRPHTRHRDNENSNNSIAKQSSPVAVSELIMTCWICCVCVGENVLRFEHTIETDSIIGQRDICAHYVKSHHLKRGILSAS